MEPRYSVFVRVWSSETSCIDGNRQDVPDLDHHRWGRRRPKRFVHTTAGGQTGNGDNREGGVILRRVVADRWRSATTAQTADFGGKDWEKPLGVSRRGPPALGLGTRVDHDRLWWTRTIRWIACGDRAGARRQVPGARWRFSGSGTGRKARGRIPTRTQPPVWSRPGRDPGTSMGVPIELSVRVRLARPEPFRPESRTSRPSGPTRTPHRFPFPSRFIRSSGAPAGPDRRGR